MAVLLALPVPAFAAIGAEKQGVAGIQRPDRYRKRRPPRLTVQAKGAVPGGGWKHAALKPSKSAAPGDAHVLVLDFVAEPPQPGDAVIPGLLPVSAAITLKARKGTVSVRAVSAANEITTQILR